LTLSQNLAASHDSTYYLASIETHQGDYYHPHHLFYAPLASAWLSVWRGLGSQLPTPDVVALLNSVFGALGLGVFYTILRKRIGLSTLSSVLGSMLAAFSFGF